MLKQNIQALRRAICAGCLSQDRTLRSIQDFKEYAFFCYALTFNEDDWVCWECMQMVIKLGGFRTRVIKAQSSLADLLGGRPCQINSLSRLTTVVTVSENPNDENFEDVQSIDPLYYQLVKDTVQIEYNAAGGDEVKGDDEAMGDDEATGDDEAMGDEEVLDDDIAEVAVVEEIICEDKNEIKNEASVQITLDHNYQTVSNVVVKPIEDGSKLTYDKNKDKIFGNIGVVHLNFDEPGISFLIKNFGTNEIAKNITMLNKREEMPLLQPKPEIEEKTHSVIKLITRNTGRKGAQESIIEVDNPFTVEPMTHEEMLIWRVRKGNMKFFTDASPLKRCENCVEPFDSQRMYTAHMKGHTQDYGEKSCEICQLRFHDDQAVEAHKEKHYKLLKCKQCEFQWDSWNGMRRHCASFHSVPVAAWLCDQCDREFGDLHKLMRHRMCHLARKCPECGIMLRSFVKKHMMRVHKNLPLLECEACGLQCKGNSGLQDHVKNCRNVADQTYCVECNVEYKNKYTYRAHFRNTVRHATNDQLKFQCAECGRGFLDAAALQNHRDSVHDRQRKYMCDHCGKGFFTLLSRKKHERRAHSSRPIRKNKVCDVCGKTFEKRRTLLEHMNTHTGARPYKCACGAEFSYECALRNHERKKHGAP